MKTAVENIVAKRWPELKSKVHLPLFAVVTAIADPPRSGQICTEEHPYYAVDVRLLTEDGELDEAMPLICDVPVAMTGSAPGRGFASLPQPGTIVELAFAFGRQDKPFIRSVLPYGMALPVCSEKSQRWQQSPESFLEVDDIGNWNHKTDENVTSEIDKNLNITVHQNLNVQTGLNETRETIGNLKTTALNITRTANLKMNDTALIEYVLSSAQIWIGSEAFNFLMLVSQFMQSTIQALTILAAHTHKNQGSGPPEPSGDISSAASQIGQQMASLNTFTLQQKTPPGAE